MGELPVDPGCDLPAVLDAAHDDVLGVRVCVHQAGLLIDGRQRRRRMPAQGEPATLFVGIQAVLIKHAVSDDLSEQRRPGPNRRLDRQVLIAEEARCRELDAAYLRQRLANGTTQPGEVDALSQCLLQNNARDVLGHHATVLSQFHHGNGNHLGGDAHHRRLDHRRSPSETQDEPTIVGSDQRRPP